MLQVVLSTFLLQAIVVCNGLPDPGISNSGNHLQVSKITKGHPSTRETSNHVRRTLVLGVLRRSPKDTIGLPIGKLLPMTHTVSFAKWLLRPVTIFYDTPKRKKRVFLAL